MILYLLILAQILITTVAVCGVYVLIGLIGMFSLGRATFMAVGSYTSGILVVKCDFPFQLVCTLAVLITMVIGYLADFPTVRLRRDYISFVTLGFGKAITALFNRVTKLIGGASGFIGVSRKTTLLLALVSAIAATAIISWFKTSRYDRRCIAVRSDELAAKAMGINVSKVKISALLFSVAAMAFSDCLYAFFTIYADPTIFGQKENADWIIMISFGGVNSLTGSVVGASVFSGFPEVLRSLDQYYSTIYAILVLLTINFKPSGIFEEWGLSPRNPKALGEKLVKRSWKEERTDDTV